MNREIFICIFLNPRILGSDSYIKCFVIFIPDSTLFCYSFFTYHIEQVVTYVGLLYEEYNGLLFLQHGSSDLTPVNTSENCWIIPSVV